MRHCGDLGHESRDGQPCRKPQAWGVDGLDTGPCRYHTESVRGTREALKKRVIEYLARPELTLLEISTLVDRAPHTIWRWRQHDEDFDKGCSDAMAASDRVRVRIVEDSLYRRIITDRLNPAETIWFLKNRAPDRWRDRVDPEKTAKDGKPRFPLSWIQSLMAEAD